MGADASVLDPRADADPGKRKVVTGQSLVLPAPARPLLLLTTDNWVDYNDRRPGVAPPASAFTVIPAWAGMRWVLLRFCTRLRANLFLCWLQRLSGAVDPRVRGGDVRPATRLRRAGPHVT